MLRKIDRVILRVANLPAAVAYYRDVMGLTVVREEGRLASLRMAGEGGEGTEFILHTDPDLPGEAVYYLVDDVRELYRRRAELKLRFASPPTQVSRGFRATVKDPFDNVLLILDRTTESSAANVEDAKAPGNLFAGVENKTPVKRELLVEVYEKIGRTADDLPYTPHFESLYSQYAGAMPAPTPTRAEVWRHLLTLRKRAGNLPKLGPARSRPPAVSAEDRQKLRDMIGAEIGKRDRLPYTPRFDQIVDEFNKTQPRNLSPHLVWRLVATLAK
ncbi:MAG TPA: VOC family protein [Tepidisphaeraceae bacterium]|jgi:catechol 2,3-dioxygenase-like lactoylglutathione lyase family enzyme|nr:VOC family protein [Tepidisphaeraceae bacterium]